MNSLPSDEFLLSAPGAGGADTFDRIVRRYRAPLEAFFRRRLPDDGRAEELTQETLFAIHRLLPDYREEGKFRSLLFSIAYRQLASELRRQAGTVPLDPSQETAAADPDRFELHGAIRELPEGLREALRLTRFEGLRSDEAGAVLGCSPEAVRARVCRAVALLARRLNPSPRRKK